MKKTILKTCYIALLVLFVISCSDEDIKPEADTLKNA